MRALLVAALMLGATAGYAAELPTRVTPERVQLGQPFVEEITVPHAPGETVVLRAPSTLGDFSLLGVERREQPGATVLRAKLALYRLGAHTVPPLRVDVRGRTDASASVSVTAVPTLAPEGKPSLADIHAPIALMRLSPWLLAAVAAALLALAAVAVLAGRAVARRRTLEARTLRVLDTLAAELEAGAPPYAWWSALATVLRRYVGARAGIEALERTTAELDALLAARGLPGLDRPALIAWLTQADLVKFARDASDVDGARRAVAFARELVAATTHAEQKKGEPRAGLAVS